jgi:hypothetical protein
MWCLQSMYSIYTENLVYSTKPKLAKVQSTSEQFLKDRGCVLSLYQTKYRIKAAEQETVHMECLPWEHSSAL